MIGMKRLSQRWMPPSAAILFALLFLNPQGFAQSYSSVVNSYNPVAYWRLGGTSGTVATDSAGSNHGTYKNGVVRGVGGALYGDSDTASSFDGSNDHIEIPHSNAYLLNNGTCMVWMKADATSGDRGIFSKDANGFATGGHLSMGFSGGYAGARLQSATASYQVGWLAPPIGEWVHYTFTWGAGGMRFYVNGQLTDTDAYTGGLGTTSGGIGNYEPIAIGASRQRTPTGKLTPVDDEFDGVIDEVILFPTALSAAQIQTIYDAALPKYESLRDAYEQNSPVAWWRLGEFPGSTVANDAMGNYDGTYAGPTLGLTSIIPKDNAADFDGVNDRVEVGNIDISGTQLTILGWFKADDFGAEYGRILSKAKGTANDDHYWMLSTRPDGANYRLGFRLRAGGSTTSYTAISGNLSPGTWTFAAAVYSGSYMILYKDAVEVGRRTKTGTLNVDATVPVWIGDNPPTSGSRPFDGLIDEVALFDRALTLQELQAIHKNAFTPPPGVRILEWRETNPVN